MTNTNSNGGTNAAASGGWLGFSLSPHMASAMDEQQQQQQVQQHHGLYFPSVTAAAAAAYGLDGGVATSASSYYTPQLASMPLKSDGSLCIMEALRRSDQQDHHGTYLARQPMAGVDPFRSWFDVFLGVGPSVVDRSALLLFIQGPSWRTSWARRRSRRPPWR